MNQLERHSKDRKESTWWVSEGFRKKQAQASAAGVLAGAVVGAAPEADSLSLERVPRCRPWCRCLLRSDDALTSHDCPCRCQELVIWLLNLQQKHFYSMDSAFSNSGQRNSPSTAESSRNRELTP